MSDANGSGRVEVLYVCDFASPHSRSYIEYFARRSDEFGITVVSTRPCQPMSGVRLVELGSASPSRNWRRGLVGGAVYRGSLLLPQRMYGWLRGRQDEARIRAVAARLESWLPRIEPHVVHAFRTIPEAALGRRLCDRFAGARFFVSTWGQDLVAWAKLTRVLDRETRAVMRHADCLLPDNARDARLARGAFELSSHAAVHVMPATGGLDRATLDRLFAAAEPVSVRGSPRLLTMRGFDNIYVRLRILLEALKQFLADHPNAHLYVDAPPGHPGEGPAREWAHSLGVSDHVTFMSVDRGTLFRFMDACDLYVSATVSDGLPLSLLEALYFGQVPVVFRHESTSPPISESVNGVTYAELTPAVIATAWRRALALPATRQTRVARNRALLRDEFDRDANLAQVADLYRATAQQLATGARG